MPTLRQMENLNMDRAAPILIRIYKEENMLEVWKEDRTGKFAMARYAYDPNAPFWGMLKSGDDAFLATGRPPSVAVCDRRYVFNLDGAEDLDPSAPCPPGIATNVANVRHSPATLAASLWPYSR